MNKNQFIGTWRLLSFTSLLTNGETIYLFGERPVGYLVYSLEGYVQVAMMHENFSQSEQVASLENYLSYCGRYEIHEKVVTHHMDVASVPSWAGGKQERAYQFSADGKLLLSTIEPITIIGRSFLESKLMWERA